MIFQRSILIADAHWEPIKAGESMAIMIREFLENNQGFAKNIGDYKVPINLSEGYKTKSNVDALDPNSLMVEIEGLHAAPFATRNYTRYMAKSLKNSIPSWTNPYRRPLLKHHNEENGEPIGRIIDAEYATRDTRSGTPAIRFSVNVPDKDAIDGIKNGLLSTVSVGILAHDVRCSICGKPIVDVEEGCEEGHVRGATYDTDQGREICYWDVYDMEAKELSFVDVPSDMYAKTIDYYPASNQKSSNQPQLKERLDNNIKNPKGEPKMAELNKPTELEEAKAKVSELETKVTELTEAKDASEKKVAELTESMESLKSQVAELTEQKTALEAAAEEAKQLKESMEQDIAEAKTALKESMVDSYVTLREALGETVENVDAIKERPVEALKYSIIDMKESLSKKAPAAKPEEPKKEPPQAGSVADPTLVDIQISESAHTEKTDLKAGLKNIFSSIMSARN
jgi:predicted  nucleic acid-binding Zn-ribbon protein